MKGVKGPTTQGPFQRCCHPLQVVSGAGQHYVDTALRIPGLSPSGCSQLSADAEYVANVLNALAVAPPPGLIVLQVGWDGAARKGDSCWAAQCGHCGGSH